MKVLTASQIREADDYTIKNEPVASIELMERASKAFSNWFIRNFQNNKPIAIFCGMGNNGGDGLAIARILHEQNFKVDVYVVKDKDKGSTDFEINLDRFQQTSPVNFISEALQIPVLQSEVVIIDAIFGSGLSRPVEGLHRHVIEAINDLGFPTVAVDIASGLFSDKPNEGGSIVKPAFTVCFQVYKLAFLMPENAEFVGDLVVVEIGLDKQFLADLAIPYELISDRLIASLLKKRQKFAHKGDFGKILLVSGSWGKVGASVLCAKACLRTGAGLLSIHAPGCAYEILQATVPEAMVETDVKRKKVSRVKDFERFDTIGIGPGIGTAEETKEVVASIIKSFKKPVVLDADALNILGENKKLLKHIPKGSILTPHPKEFERLAGKFNTSYERLVLQRKFSEQYHCITIVKGAHTSISTPDGDVFFNNTGNPGMATGGSGDVLTGMVAALLGQNYNSRDAAIVAVYLHGLAGDIAANKLGQESILPSDIIDNISSAYLSFRRY